MTATAQPTYETSGYEALISYGHLRAHYLGSDITSGILHVNQFLRQEHLETLRESLLQDRAILISADNALLQRELNPVSRQCLWELQSGIMLRVLENITGLHNLLPDTRCKQTRLLFSTSMPGLDNWQDPDTRLDAALVLVIRLDQGDAEFCTTPQALAKVLTGNAAIQVTYWQHHAAVTGEQS